MQALIQSSPGIVSYATSTVWRASPGMMTILPDFGSLPFSPLYAGEVYLLGGRQHWDPGGGKGCIPLFVFCDGDLEPIRIGVDSQ